MKANRPCRSESLLFLLGALLVSVFLSGFHSTAAARSNSGSSEYYWKDGYYRAFVDNEDGEHIVGVNVPGDASENLKGFIIGSSTKGSYVSQNFSRQSKNPDSWDSYSISLYGYELSTWANVDQSSAAGTVKTRYGNVKIYAQKEEASGDYYRCSESACMDVNGESVYIRAFISSKTDDDYFGIIEEYLPQILEAAESFEFEMPKTEESELEIDPADYDAVLCDNSGNPAFGLIVPDGATLEKSGNIEDNLYRNAYLSSDTCRISAYTSSSPTYMYNIYRYFKKDSVFFDTKNMSAQKIESVELIDEVMTSSGKVYIYEAVHADDKDYEEFALANNNNIPVLIQLCTWGSHGGSVNGNSIIDFLDVTDKTEDEVHVVNPEYRFIIGSRRNPEEFCFNIPEEYAVESINKTGEGYSFTLVRDGVTAYVSVKLGDAWHDEDEIEAGVIETEYGELAIYSSGSEDDPYKNEILEIPLDERNNITISASTREEDESGEKISGYKGFLEKLVPVMLIPSETDVSFDPGDVFPEDEDLEVSGEGYEFIIAGRGGPVLGINMSEENWKYANTNKDEDNNIYFASFSRPADDHNEAVRIHLYDEHPGYSHDYDALSYIFHYFLDSKQFLNEECGTVTAITKEESLDTDFGTLDLYYAESEDADGEPFEEEIGLLANNGMYVIILYRETYYDEDYNKHGKPGDGEYDGILMKELENAFVYSEELAEENNKEFSVDELGLKDGKTDADAGKYEYLLGDYAYGSNKQVAAAGMNLPSSGWRESYSSSSDGTYSDISFQTEDYSKKLSVTVFCEDAPRSDVMIGDGYNYPAYQLIRHYFLNNHLWGHGTVTSVTELKPFASDFGEIKLYFAEIEDVDGNKSEEEFGLLLNNGMYMLFRLTDENNAYDGDCDEQLRKALEDFGMAAE